MNFDRVTVVNALAKQKLMYAEDDTDIGMIVRYVGSEASATITVASGDITFKHGDLGSEAVDSTIDSGGDDPGVIDVSDATADTLGEVVDLINASANWEAILLDCLRSDASAGALLNRSETTLTPNTENCPLYKDTSATLNIAKNISAAAFEAQKLDDGSPFAIDETDYINSLFEWAQYNTYGSGTSIMTVYERDPATNRETLLATVTGAATTELGEKDFTGAGNGWGATAEKGCQLIVIMTGSAACTGYLQVMGGSRKFGY